MVIKGVIEEPPNRSFSASRWLIKFVVGVRPPAAEPCAAVSADQARFGAIETRKIEHIATALEDSTSALECLQVDDIITPLSLSRMALGDKPALRRRATEVLDRGARLADRQNQLALGQVSLKEHEGLGSGFSLGGYSRKPV